MSSKNPNIGQQPNSAKTQKTFADALSAKNLGVDKIILNINGGNSELVTNQNSVLKYSLKQPINLEVGDTITCIGAFVEEKGLQQNTISFEEDIEAEMRFTYYKQGDAGDELNDGKDASYVAYPKFFPDSFIGVNDDRTVLSENYMSGGATNYEELIGDCTLGGNYGGFGYINNSTDVVNNKNFSQINSGANGNYYYLMESVKYKKTYSGGATRYSQNGLNNLYFRPVYGKKKIKVKAGNYSVDSLANIISAQLNGSLGKNNNEFSDALLDKLYNTNGVNGNSLFKTFPYFQNIDTDNDSSEDDIIGTTGEQKGFERKVEGLVKEINFSQYNYYECFAFQNIFSYLKNSPEVTDRLIAGLGNQFPNGKNEIIPTENFDLGIETEAPDFIQLTEADTKYGNGQENIHFYMNGNGLDLFYNSSESLNLNAWNNLDGLKDNTANADNPYFPCTLEELMFMTIDPIFGYIPNVLTNAAITGPYENTNRFALIDHAIAAQTLFPVKGLRYPSTENVLPSRQKYAGTSVAEVTFGDQVSNRFAIGNLHEFYKLSNLTSDGKASSGFGGQQATKFNNPYFNDNASGGAASNIIKPSIQNISAIYPIDSSSGVAVNNFDFDLVKDTKIYKDLVAEIQSIDGDTAEFQQLIYKEQLIFNLFTKPFDQFFATKQDAEKVWAKSLWARIGFTYDQLGNISQNLESYVGTGKGRKNTDGSNYYTKNPIKQKGIITHNAFDFSKIVSSDGLGQGNPEIANGTPLQDYRLESYFTGGPLLENLGLSGNLIHLLGTSKPINAQQLPSLNNGKSYLLIESDLVKPNFKDNKANWGNLLAVMSKENASNDTIFGSDPIEFIVTEPRLLTDITIYIKNPDGTLAAEDVVGENSGFLIEITKPIAITKLISVSN